MNIEVGKYLFKFQLDSKNSIFSFQVLTEELTESQKAAVIASVQDLVIEADPREVFKKLKEDLKKHFDKNDLGFFLWNLKIAFNILIGDKPQFILNPKRDQVLCRCVGYSMTDLENFVHENPDFDGRGIRRETGITMNCGSCLEEFNSYYERYRILHSDRVGEQLRQKIEEILPKFKDYSHYVDIDIELIKIEFPVISVQLTNASQAKSLAIKNQLINFLSRELECAVDVELALT